MAKMHQYPGFLFVNSDLYNHTPNLQVDILRDQAKLYGVSETRILTLLHDAYSQNYSYLIKKPTDQYQVILEVADDQRSDPKDLSKLYIKSDDGQRMVPLNAVTSWHPVIGPQAVNHINQFTSVTMFFNLKPGYSIGPATQFVEQTAKEILPPGDQGQLQGEALDVPQHGFGPDDADAAGRVRHVRDSGDSVRELSAPDHGAFVACRWRLVGGLLTLWLFGAEASLYAYIGMFMLMGIVKKNGIMIVDFAEQRVRQGIRGRSGDSRRQHGALPPHHDDDRGGAAGRAADRAGLWRRWRLAPATGPGRRRRSDRLAVHHAVHHAGDLSVPRGIPGEGAGSVLLPAVNSQTCLVGRRGFGDAGRTWRLIAMSQGVQAFPYIACGRSTGHGRTGRLHRRSELQAAGG